MTVLGKGVQVFVGFDDNSEFIASRDDPRMQRGVIVDGPFGKAHMTKHFGELMTFDNCPNPYWLVRVNLTHYVQEPYLIPIDDNDVQVDELVSYETEGDS